MEKIYTGIAPLIIETDDITALSQSVLADLSNGDIVVLKDENGKLTFVCSQRKELNKMSFSSVSASKVVEVEYECDENDKWSYSKTTETELGGDSGNAPKVWNIEGDLDGGDFDYDMAVDVQAGDVVVCHYQEEDEDDFVNDNYGAFQVLNKSLDSDGYVSVVLGSYDCEDDGSIITWNIYGNNSDDLSFDEYSHSLTPPEPQYPESFICEHTLSITGRNDDDSGDVSVVVKTLSWSDDDMSIEQASCNDIYEAFNSGLISAKLQLSSNEWTPVLETRNNTFITFYYMENGVIKNVEVYDGSQHDSVSIEDDVNIKALYQE